MEFDVSRVYTALNADRLKPGSKCFFADGLGALKLRVKDGDCPKVLDDVLSEDFIGRFITGEVNYSLAYLIEEPAPLKWKEIKVGDVLRNVDTGAVLMVTGLDPDSSVEAHVFMGTQWYPDSSLDSWIKVDVKDGQNGDRSLVR